MNTNVPLGIGVDIIELRRFREINHLSRVAELILTPNEYSRFLNHSDRIEYLASRFALKEAVIKACPALLTYHDVEIVHMGKKPQARLLSLHAKEYRVLVSLSHSMEYAAGFAMAF